MLDFKRTLQETLQEETFDGKTFRIEPEVDRCDSLEEYASKKWQLIDTINKKYNTTFSLHHWLQKKDDEVATFLCEAGANSIQGQGPIGFNLWLGKKSFIIGIQQKKEFNASQINQEEIKQNKGAGFNFFREARNTIFFNHPTQTTEVFLHYVLYH